MATSPKISPLSDHVINQIAAGEVIERPLSIVKELVENSLDAGSSAIEVRIASGGAELISVRDNGHGIEVSDLNLAVQRHCTSKLSDADELQQLNSLGFRGEALASIAAVSKLSLISRTANCSHASEINCSYGDLSEERAAASYPPGTVVNVEDLFANTPARRKFLRQARTENLQISQLLRHIAFCHDDVSFSYFVDGKKVLSVSQSTGVESEQRRLRELFGKEFAERGIRLERQEQGLAVTGWVGPIDSHRPRGDIQFLSVNRRVVKDRTLIHAIRLAYDGKIPEGRYASYALDINISPDEVDVNVHPTKTEVRFVEPRRIHDQLYSFVSSSLSLHSDLLGLANSSPATITQSSPYNRTDAQGIASPGVKESRYQRRGYSKASTSKRSRIAHNLLSEEKSEANIFAGLFCDRFVLVNPHSTEGLSAQDGTSSSPIFLDIVPLLTGLFRARLANDARSRPLIVPEVIRAELHDFFLPRAEQFHEFGMVITNPSSAKLVLKELPLVLFPINYETFLTSLSEDGVKTDEPEWLGDIASAAAGSVLVPSELTAQQRWFAQILEQLRGVGLKWQDYQVSRSDQQWQKFLGS